MSEKPPRSLLQGLAAYRTVTKQKPKEDGGFLKSGQPPVAPPPEVPGGGERKKGEQKESKVRRVAKFLILIGGEEASKILSRLEPEQVENICREIATIKNVPPDEGERILREFRDILSSSPQALAAPGGGGVETARRLLHGAFGEEEGERFLNRLLPQTRKNPFAFLEDFTPVHLALLLQGESPAASALVLSRLSPKLAAQAVGHLEGERRVDVLKRIARMGQVSPEVLEQAAAALREKARDLSAALETAPEAPDGRSSLAAILKAADVSFGEQLLREIGQSDPALEEDIQKRLYTLEDVVRAEDRPIQEKLQTMTDQEIVLLLKGRSPGFEAKIVKNLSANRYALIREEGEIMGQVPRRDADRVAGDFLAWFRQTREAGRIIIADEDELV